MSKTIRKLTKSFNFFKVKLLALVSCVLILSVSCTGGSGGGAGRELSFDEFNTFGLKDAWLDSEEPAVPLIYEDEYIIGAKDAIAVDVADHDEFNTQTIVNLDGEISLPLIDEPVLVEGLTLTQAADAVSLFLSPFINGDVICEVELLATGSRFYYVLGDGTTTLPNLGGNQSSNDRFSEGMGSIRKIPMGAEPITLRDLILEHEDSTDLENIAIFRPDFTDKKRPRFMTIDMSDIPRAIWNVDYRIRPNDIVVVRLTFKERLKNVLNLFVDEVDDADQTDQNFERMLRFLNARLSNDSENEERFRDFNDRDD